MNEDDFNPNPIVNHMIHWKPWAEKFKDDPDHEKRALAQMLGFAHEEKERLCIKGYKTSLAHSILLFAYIGVVETGEAKPLEEGSDSLGSAWKDIQMLNQWRKENKLNIKLVDVG